MKLFTILSKKTITKKVLNLCQKCWRSSLDFSKNHSRNYASFSVRHSEYQLLMVESEEWWLRLSWTTLRKFLLFSASTRSHSSQWSRWFSIIWWRSAKKSTKNGCDQLRDTTKICKTTMISRPLDSAWVRLIDSSIRLDNKKCYQFCHLLYKNFWWIMIGDTSTLQLWHYLRSVSTSRMSRRSHLFWWWS